MKPLSLSVVLAAAFASSTVQAAPQPEPATSESRPAVIPSLYTPSTLTPSGRRFIARCSDEAFAKTRYPDGLADQCERLLGLWHREANAQQDPRREAYIPNYRNALRISSFNQPLNVR